MHARPLRPHLRRCCTKDFCNEDTPAVLHFASPASAAHQTHGDSGGVTKGAAAGLSIGLFFAGAATPAARVRFQSMLACCLTFTRALFGLCAACLPLQSL